MDIHKNLNQTTELDSARNDLSVEKKLLDCIENLVMNDDFTAAVNSGLTTILEYYDADRTYIFEFQWKENLTRNTYEICRDGISPQIENLQTVPVDVVARWVDSFEDQEQNTIIFIGDVDALKDDPTRRLEYDCLHPQGIKSLIAIPIFINGKLHGFLGIDNPRSHKDALTLLTQLTYIIANELQKRLLTEALTKKSYQDPLTGLNNRLAYDEMLELASQGAQVLHNRSVELAKKFRVNLEVVSSLERKPGTKIKEVTKVEKTNIAGVAKDTSIARVALVGLQHNPGVAFQVFDLLSKHNINVDVILQSIGREETKDITFTVHKKDLDEVEDILNQHKEALRFDHIEADDKIGKVSIVGAGLMSNCGVAAKMFESLYNEGVNINMISTSEIRVTVLINEKDGVRAMNAVHDAFNLAD